MGLLKITIILSNVFIEALPVGQKRHLLVDRNWNVASISCGAIRG